MASEIYEQIRTGFRNLNPNQVRVMTERRLRVGLIASTGAGFASLEELLAPPSPEPRRCEIERLVEGALDEASGRLDLVLCQSELLPPPGAFRVDAADRERTIREIVARREDLRLALARNFRAFRRPVIGRIVKTISRENALFCLLTALPDVLPSLIELPWQPASSPPTRRF